MGEEEHAQMYKMKYCLLLMVFAFTPWPSDNYKNVLSPNRSFPPHRCLIQGVTETANITCSPKLNSNLILKKILTNLEELSFLTVLAFPKAEEREKQIRRPNQSVKEYLNAKTSMTLYIFKRIKDFRQKKMYGYQSLGIDRVWQARSQMGKHLRKSKKVLSQRFLYSKKWKKNI